MTKKIAILGTGANGSGVAASLIEAGYDPMLIDQWPAHVEAMRAGGLTISMPDRELHVRPRAHHLCDVASLNETFDLVFLVVKAYDTRWLAEFIKPHLAEDGLLVGLQNAMTALEIRDIVGPKRTIACVVEMSSEIFTPGRVQRNTTPAGTWFGLGSIDPSMDHRIAEVEEVLRNVGKVSITKDVLSAKWMKLVVNTMCLGPTALLGLPLSEGAKLPGMRELIMKVGAEALRAGQEAGYTIEPIFGLNPEDVKGTNQLLEKLFDKLVRDVGPRARDCVLQDHLKGRYSEVDLINGWVVDECAKKGQSAPGNAVVVELSRKIQRGELKPVPENVALARKMMGM